MKLPRFLPSGDVLESPRQLVHSLDFLLHVTKRIFLDPVVCAGLAETGFSSFWLVRPAMVVCRKFLYSGTSPPLSDVNFLRGSSGWSVFVDLRIFCVAALGDLYFWIFACHFLFFAFRLRTVLVSHTSGSIGCEVWRAMVSIFCLSPYWDHKPGGGMGGVGPPPASRGPDLGGLLLELFAGEYLPFWSFITRICGAQCYAGFSVSISTVSQVTFRLQVACLRLPLFLSDHETAEVSAIWGRSRVTAPAGSLP